jgi:uncharacterized membrane protein YcfT
VILVVMMHSAVGAGEAMGGEGPLHWIVAFAKPFRMPDFFVISGLFLARTIDRDWRTYLDRKVVHFAYFYFLWLFIQWFLKSGVAGGQDPRAALEQLALAVFEPFGTLWFIYVLPLFFVATKLSRQIPPAVVLAVAALLETARIHTGWTVPDELAARYVYFLAGYLFAPHVFALAERVVADRRRALFWLLAWAASNGFLAFAPSPFAAFPTLASLPLISLVAGFAGAAAVVVSAALLSELRGAGWLRYCGANSLVIYLGFFLPMAAARIVIVKFDLTTSVGLASAVAMACGVAGPLLLHRVTRDGAFRFLFERPAAFRLPATAPRAGQEPVRQNAA